MTPQTQIRTDADPWAGKGQRFWLIAALASLICITFAAYDGGNFYARYLQLCTEQPERPECKPLNLVQEKRPPDLGVTLYYEKGKWALDVGPRQEEWQANDLVSRLKSYGVEARAIKIPGRGKTARYQVQIGRFLNRKSALEAGTQLQGKGVIQDFRPSDYQTPK